MEQAERNMGWLGIFRLGLVQAAIGAVVVITTSTMNRVMVVELAMPALLPGLLVALHYFVQVLRPRLGYGSDVGGRRTPWIIGGMAALGAGAIGAALATALMSTNPALGIALAVLSFLVIGLGVGACGTSMLVLMSTSVRQDRLAAAATVTWVMMIVGFIVTTVFAGKLLDPFSLTRLVEVTAGVCAAALAVTALAVHGIEGRVARPARLATADAAEPAFRDALRQVWSEPHARRLASFIFVSMLAYSAQDLILEPFAGAVFGLTPGESTQLSGLQSGGVLLGMLAVALVCTAGSRWRIGSLRTWTIVGCVASSLLLVALAAASFAGPGWPLRPTVFALGLANGAFAVAAIGSMMGLVGRGHRAREGVRMGLWGAAQAVAFGLGGLAGTAVVDLARYALGSPVAAYAFVFVAEAVLFVLATVFAVRLSRDDVDSQAYAASPQEPSAGGGYAAPAGGR
jgi:BCD family chlorophyll transporter-like MFS transporter